jgi:hypothetical protein
MELLSRKSVLLPLLFLFFAFNSCQDSNKNFEKSKKTAEDLSQKIENDFGKILNEATMLAKQTSALYLKKQLILPGIDKRKYTLASNGCFYKQGNDTNTSALWISGYVPIDEALKEVAYFTEPLDTTMKRICTQNSEVVQVYYNDKSSLNRIYPWFDAMAQYEPKMNIPSFNFYFAADEKHNPEKKAVWVNEPYVDPAGRGWMVSAIAPVYINNILEGVVGLDVTIITIVDKYTDLEEGGAIAIFSRSGTLVAASEPSSSILEMPAFKQHKYIETVKENTFKPDDYNILKTRDRTIRKMADAIFHNHESSFELKSSKQNYLVTTSTIKELDWILLYFTQLE